jgi:cellulose biosynthesis protein BcsQ
MKLKLVLLDSDSIYMERLVSAFSVRQECSLETYSFTSLQDALAALHHTSADILIAADSYVIGPESIPERCSFAYLTDSAATGKVRGQPSICRYQKAEFIYREILSIYYEQNGGPAEKNGALLFPVDAGETAERKTTRIYAFAPCGGGSGASSVAVACALRLTRSGKSVLYLNLERFGTSGSYYESEGRLHLGDVLYAVRSKRTNSGIKLINAIKRDECGVRFIDSCRVAPEVMEMTAQDASELIDELKALCMFDYIIADIDLLLDGALLAVMKKADANVIVSDGSESSIVKLERLAKAMEIISERDEFSFPAIYLLYNKFSSKNSQCTSIDEFTLLGTAPRYEGASQSKIIRRLAELPIFDGLP